MIQCLSVAGCDEAGYYPFHMVRFERDILDRRLAGSEFPSFCMMLTTLSQQSLDPPFLFFFFLLRSRCTVPKVFVAMSVPEIGELSLPPRHTFFPPPFMPHGGSLFLYSSRGEALRVIFLFTLQIKFHRSFLKTLFARYAQPYRSPRSPMTRFLTGLTD